MDDTLAQLIDMGFDPSVSQLALEQTNYQGVQQAIEYIYGLSTSNNLSGVKQGSTIGQTPPSSQQPLQSQKTLVDLTQGNNNSSNLTKTHVADQQLTSNKPKSQKTSLKSSIRESSETNSDDEYYQDVDDYEFDVPVQEIFTTNNSVIQARELIKTALVEIDNITNITETSPSEATLLLLHFQWNSNKLLERYYEDPDRVKQQAGVKAIDQYKIKINVPGQDCIICGDSLDQNNGSYLSCQHYACSDCWDGFITNKIKDGESIGMTCLSFKCTNIIPDIFVKEVVPKQYNKYLERLAQTFVDKNPNMRWCPVAGCGNALKADSKAETVASCTCGFKICFKCNQESHIPANCDQMKQWKKKCEDDSETANWIQSNTQDCPQCHSSIEKNGGCNHMTCKKCKHEFCWVCLGNWKNHSKCNTFDKDKVSKSESKKNLERYLFYFHRFNIHEQSKKFETKLRASTLETIMSIQNKKDKRWIDVKFLIQSTEILIQCRRTLKYTYVFGFYLPDGAEKNLFEYLQNDLEKTTEHLSGLLEKAEDKNIFDIKEVTNLASTKLRHLLEGVEEGLTLGGTKR
ncbi:ubiquitin-protein ligase (E3) [Tieghemostelium lacteum]|uniref:RBR-type E3 ubiquitin transferase n=1 Tax=Tieghemostelium lacteum TaxID=361077 RepID=A0A151Z4R9_TIELA|nr:ubiquitin-protein ligase (E3) [Tieghemostelium lacteum]|eukprot:KYQ88963.1 ubiquitin-protein ligase (E3) [Tieghemostelium lacteum]